MADIFSGPNAPLTKAFLFCGWRCLTLDIQLDSSHDLAHPLRQQSLREQLKEADFVSAAFDCSTKSRAREVPRVFDDGRRGPGPLRSTRQPEGLDGLSPADQHRVKRDNNACGFMLQVMQEVAERGAGAMRENPVNSLHWLLQQEVAAFRTGLWADTHYDACCWGGARCKRQRLRHNIPEISSWPPLQCHHVHASDEWQPYLLNGRYVYPTKEEAEYTAPFVFAVAVSVSWWAVRVGRAKLAVPRMPTPCCVGRREEWPLMDPRSLRSWALAPLAISLGLGPASAEEAARIPPRKVVEAVIGADGTLPRNCIYVGPGHHRHRLARSKWAPPFTAGHDCAFDEFLPRYVQHIRDNLSDHLTELIGKVLVVDAVAEHPSEGDALAGLVFEHLSTVRSTSQPQQSTNPRGRARKRSHRFPRALGLAIAPLADASSIFSDFMRQEDVVLAVRKLFPEAWMTGFTFPCIEDLINAPPFDLYRRWLRVSELDWAGACGPATGPSTVRILQRAAGQQAGALSQRAALPPVISFGLPADVHFQQALARIRTPMPTEQAPVLDNDLQFAADFTASQRTRLRQWRQDAMGALRELKRRCAALDAHLRGFQQPALRRVTAARDVGLVAILVVLFAWPDTALPFSLIAGMPAVGFAPCYGIFPQMPADHISYEDVLGDWRAHNAKILQSIGPSRDDDFLLSQSTKDFESGFCSPPLTKQALLAQLKGKPFRLVPRCVITQSSGKKRIIDNADTGGQSASSRESNKLVLCSALRPAQHAQAVIARLPQGELERARESDSLESGGEDWPDAYRHCPMSEEEALCCLVVWWHREWQAPAFQIYSGLLFGLPLAVTSFNRYSRFSEAASRRVALTVTSSYFDDFNMVDWSSSKGSGQWAVGELNKCLGTPFAEEKRQPMAVQGSFLGLDHDLSEALQRGFVTFWARERLFTKMSDLIEQSETASSLKAGLAAKMFGLMNFLEQGMYGRVGCGGLAALCDRQRSKESDLSPDILQTFQLIRALLKFRPERRFWVSNPPVQRFIAASDAAEEKPQAGTGGFLLIWQQGASQVREGFVAACPEELYALWGPGDKKIAQLELSMVLFALVARPARFRMRRGIWYIDNTAALMALIRGRSDNSDLSRLAQLIHLCLFVFQTWIYWEWVPSKSNWSDAISRLGVDDEWHQSHSFSTSLAFFPFQLWALPLEAAIRVFEYL